MKAWIPPPAAQAVSSIAGKRRSTKSSTPSSSSESSDDSKDNSKPGQSQANKKLNRKTSLRDNDDGDISSVSTRRSKTERNHYILRTAIDEKYVP